MSDDIKALENSVMAIIKINETMARSLMTLTEANRSLAFSTAKAVDLVIDIMGGEIGMETEFTFHPPPKKGENGDEPSVIKFPPRPNTTGSTDGDNVA